MATPVFLPGRSHEQRSLVGYSPLGNKSHTWLSDSIISSVAHSCLTLCDPVDCSTPGFPVHHHLPEFVQTHVHRVSDAIHLLILCCPLLLLPSVFPSIRVFSSESVFHIRWPKYWSFTFSISPSNEFSGLISFRTKPLYIPMYIHILFHYGLFIIGYQI